MVFDMCAWFPSADKSKRRRRREEPVVEEEVFNINNGWKIDMDSTEKARCLLGVALL